MTLTKEHAPFLVQCSGGRFIEREELHINSLQTIQYHNYPLSAAIHFLQTP